MSDRSDDVTRGVILGYLMVSNPVFAIGYLVSGLPWWIWALAALVGAVVALVWFLMCLAAKLWTLAVEVWETDWLAAIAGEPEPGADHPERSDPRFEAELARTLGFEKAVSTRR
jgi:hypothetical protein